MMPQKIRLVASGFGDPKSGGTASGVPLNFFKELSKSVDIVHTISSNQLKLIDIFRGIVDPTKSFHRRKFSLRPNKRWTQKTVGIFSRRIENELKNIAEFDCVFEIGTNFWLNIPGVRHFSRSDMTIAQAARSGFFRGGKLSPSELIEAIKTQRLVYDNCDGIFVPSAWTKNSIIEDYGQCPDKVHVVGLGANLPSVEFEGKTDFLPNIVFVGRDWHRKGGELLVEAFRIVRKEIPEARLSIVGCSPKLQEESVSVLGHLDKQNPKDMAVLQGVLRSSSILCVPSIYEPFGICFVEAQLMGVVPVSFSGEGRDEAILDGVSGVLVTERSAGALAHAITNLLSNQSKLQNMHMAGQQYALANFTWSRVIEKVSAVMQKN